MMGILLMEMDEVLPELLKTDINAPKGIEIQMIFDGKYEEMVWISATMVEMTAIQFRVMAEAQSVLLKWAGLEQVELLQPLIHELKFVVMDSGQIMLEMTIILLMEMDVIAHAQLSLDGCVEVKLLPFDGKYLNQLSFTPPLKEH
jgi:hypothetical protein